MYFVISTQNLYCQNKSDKGFLEFITEADARLVALESNKMAKFQTQEKFDYIRLVKTDNIVKYQINSTLSINIPHLEELVYAKANSIEAFDYNNYTWTGDIIEHSGFVILIAEHGNVFGQIQLNGETFELSSLKPGISVLKHYDKTSFSSAPSCVIGNTKKDQPQEPKGQVRSSCDAIRILYLATIDASNELGGLSGVSQMATTSTNILNSSMNNSDIDASFNIADVQILTGINASDYQQTEIANKVMLNDLENMAESIRNDEQADLVVLFCTNDMYYAGVSEGTGPLNAYCQVNLDYANSEFSLGHEIGHLMGGDHERCDQNPVSYACIQSTVPGDNRARIFKIGLWSHRATIMRSATSGPNGINYYSNPDISYSGEPTGVSNESDNARTLDFNACTVANLKPYDPPMSVTINGPHKAYNTGNYTWCATTSNCSNVTSYNWDYSTDGFNYYPWSTFPCNVAPMPLDHDLYLRVTATCSDGQTATDFYLTLNLDAPYLKFDTSYIKDQAKVQKYDRHADFKGVKIFPNPSSGSSINVTFQLARSGRVYLDLLDNLGNKIKRYSKAIYDKGYHKIALNLYDLPPGLYILRTATAHDVFSNKLILTP